MRQPDLKLSNEPRVGDEAPEAHSRNTDACLNGPKPLLLLLSAMSPASGQPAPHGQATMAAVGTRDLNDLADPWTAAAWRSGTRVTITKTAVWPPPSGEGPSLYYHFQRTFPTQDTTCLK